MHLCKIISTFHKDHPKKLIATLSQKDSALLINKPTVKLVAKALKAYIKRKYEKTPRISSKQTREV